MGRRPSRAGHPALSPDPRDIPTPRRARVDLTFENQALLGALFGQFDANLVQVENRLGVYIHARGHQVVIEGPEDDVARARETLKTMYDRLARGEALDSGAIEALIAMSSEPTLEGIISGEQDGPPIMIRTRKKTIVPRSATQIEYMRSLAKDDIIFALGPAGTGKTYIAVAQAVSQLITGSVHDALNDCMPPEQGERRLANGEIEIAPIAFMRGRTLADSFIILDEAQNTTKEQMKMFLTRFGEKSRMVVCGDPRQVDIPGGPRMSGLNDAVEKLEGIEGFGTIRFTTADVVRHPIVGRIVEAYEGNGEEG
jgi:phosphate starvation-inducible protein PhoH and related proteins